MGDVQLTTPFVRVIRDDFDPLEIQTTNADLVRWDRTRYKHKWPNVGDAPFLWLTFISWCAARRQGAIPADVTYEQWELQVLECTALNVDEGDESGNPIPLAVDPE